MTPLQLRHVLFRTGAGRDRAEVAVLDGAAGLQPAAALRHEVHRLRLHQEAAHHGAPRHLRLHRALLRHPHRELCG